MLALNSLDCRLHLLSYSVERCLFNVVRFRGVFPSGLSGCTVGLEGKGDVVAASGISPLVAHTVDSQTVLLIF